MLIFFSGCLGQNGLGTVSGKVRGVMLSRSTMKGRKIGLGSKIALKLFAALFFFRIYFFLHCTIFLLLTAFAFCFLIFAFFFSYFISFFAPSTPLPQPHLPPLSLSLLSFISIQLLSSPKRHLYQITISLAKMIPEERLSPVVLISGASLGGLLLGVLLEQAGIQYHIFEKSATHSSLGIVQEKADEKK